MFQKFFSICLVLLVAQAIHAQNNVLYGTVNDSENNVGLADASIVAAGTGKVAVTDTRGYYRMENIPAGTYSFIVSKAGYLPTDLYINVTANTETKLQFSLQKDPAAISNSTLSDIPTITMEEAEAETEGSGGVSNLLNASRDVMQQVAGFGWWAFRFRERGYDSEHFPLYLNGVSINDPETGTAYYGEIGGLNDVLRIRESSVGLAPCSFAFTEIGGATNIDLRASTQRKQIRATYAISNRTYTNRAMITLNSGLMPGGWAVSASGSRRWGQEGYFEGTFFDGYSYFLSVDKKINSRHALSLTFLGSPNSQGRRGDTFEEMYELAGSHRYNPNWGYQNGEKRNAVVATNNQPMGILRYDMNPLKGTFLTSSVYGQAGKRGYSRLEWFEANNPAPDYNRRLPSAILEPSLAAEWAEALRNDEKLRQIDWDRFYEENRRNNYTVVNAEGISGNNVTGNRSQYIVEDQRSDSKEIGFNTVLDQRLDDRSKLHAGVNYRWYTGQNFKVVDDLLGGDYWLDINKYASQDFPGQPEKEYNDLLKPNHIVREGDVFGYDYDENIRDGGIWLQMQTDLNRFTLSGGGEIGLTRFWRTGNAQNPRFPDNSLGDSEKQSYYTYGAKAGVTYKINGRNYLNANGFIGTNAPQFRDVFLAPRNRNDVVPGGVDPFEIQSAEASYIHRSPYWRSRISGFITNFKNETTSSTYFFPTLGEFATLIQTGLDRQHMGVEAAFQYKLSPSWEISGACNLGYYHYTSRPYMYFTGDNTGAVTFDSILSYQDNFLVPRTPQTAATAGLRYQGKRFWFATLSFNWSDNFWYAYDATRRRAEAVLSLEPGSEIWNTIVDQTKAPASYTLDFFGGKS